MHKISYLKPLNDKNLRFLYETISKHLHNLESLVDTKQIEGYQTDLKAYLNGYTKKDSLFKDLRKIDDASYPIHLSILLEYAKFKNQYIQNNQLKSLEDLYAYCKHTSTLSFLLLICGEDFLKPLELINEVALIDVLTNILTNFQTLKKSGQINFPLMLINDYDIDTTLDGNYLLNAKFIAMWDMLAYKVFMLIQNISSKLHLFEDNHQIILKEFLKDIKQTLMHFEKTVIKINR